MARGHSAGAYQALLLALLTRGLASPAFAQQRQSLNALFFGGEVQGTVRLEEGKKDVAKAVVRLEDPQGRVVEEETVSANGQFCFSGLAQMQYTLIATAAGHETYVQALDLTNGGGVRAVNIIVLRPIKNEATTAISGAPRTDASAPKKARKELERGVRASEGQKLSEARDHFEKAVNIYPCYARALVGLALAMMRERDAQHAEAPLKKAIECDPDFVEPYLHLGRLFISEQRYAESRTVLSNGVRRAPSSWVLYYHLGEADEGLKNYALAEQELLRALSFGHGVSAAVHEKLADVYLRQNAYEKAYAEMCAYLQAEPNGPYAARIKAMMRQLESSGRVHTSQGEPVARPPGNSLATLPPHSP